MEAVQHRQCYMVEITGGEDVICEQYCPPQLRGYGAAMINAIWILHFQDILYAICSLQFLSKIIIKLIRYLFHQIFIY